MCRHQTPTMQIITIMPQMDIKQVCLGMQFSKLYSQTNGEHEYCLCVCPALLANIPIHIHTCFLSITQCKGGKVCVIEILVFIMAIMLKSPHSSYMFFFIISHISSKKRGKVCMRYLCPLWLSCLSPHNLYNILLYHSNGTKGTSQKRKHEEGENEKVAIANTNKSKFMKMKRGNNVRINTYTASRIKPTWMKRLFIVIK